jgi:hypothetical protein
MIIKLQKKTKIKNDKKITKKVIWKFGLSEKKILK